MEHLDEIVGSINQSGGTLAIDRCTLAGNQAHFGGGAIRKSTAGTLSIRNSTITGNQANAGGGIDAPGGVLDIFHCTVTGNQALSNWRRRGV